MSKERIDPFVQEDLYAVDHILRYMFISPWVKGKSVLDAACGSGFGSVLLARNGAAQVTGIDNCAEVIEQCQQNFPDSQVSFRQSSLEHIDDLSLAPVDCVVSFETLEHVRDPWLCLDRLSACLKPDGVLILSVPGETDLEENNEFHLHHFTIAQMRAELARRFRTVNCLQQKFSVHSTIQPLDNREPEPIEMASCPIHRIALKGETAGADTYLFLAGNAQLPPPITGQAGQSRNAWLLLQQERRKLYGKTAEFDREIKTLHQSFKIQFAKNSDLIKKFTNVLSWGEYNYKKANGKLPEKHYMDAIIEAQSERERVLERRIAELEQELAAARSKSAC